MTAIELGDKINQAGRSFKVWFTDFTLVYSPILIVGGLILTGIDLYLNLGIGNSLWFKLPWSIAQLFAVDGLWFAIWNRILTDEYKWKWIAYHLFIILLGIAMTGIAVVMTYIILTQDYMHLRDSVAAMNSVGIPVGLFLLVRAVLLMLTATLAIVLDRVMRDTHRPKKFTHKPEKSMPTIDRKPDVVVTESIDRPTLVALPSPKSMDNGYREKIKVAIEKYNLEGKVYTYQDIVTETGASMATVKKWAPKIKAEIAS